MYVLPTIPKPVALRKYSVETIWYTRLNLVRASVLTSKILADGCGSLRALCCPRQALYVKSLCLFNCHLRIWSGLSSLSALCMRGQFQISLRVFHGCQPTSMVLYSIIYIHIELSERINKSMREANCQPGTRKWIIYFETVMDVN